MADYLRDIDLKDFLIQSCDVDSGIDSQPLDEWTVLQGARNRAINALESGGAEGVGVGLEGGLTVVPGDDRYYLVCTAVIRDRLGVDLLV